MDVQALTVLKDFGYPAVMSIMLLMLLGKNLESIKKELAEIKGKLEMLQKTSDDIKDNQETRPRR